MNLTSNPYNFVLGILASLLGLFLFFGGLIAIYAEGYQLRLLSIIVMGGIWIALGFVLFAMNIAKQAKYNVTLSLISLTAVLSFPISILLAEALIPRGAEGVGRSIRYLIWNGIPQSLFMSGVILAFRVRGRIDDGNKLLYVPSLVIALVTFICFIVFYIYQVLTGPFFWPG